MNNGHWVAFLRGINLGNRTVRMEELRRVFQEGGFSRVATILASGNVLFSSAHPPDAQHVAQMLETAFGFPVAVVLRSLDQLQKMVASDPFAGWEADRNTKFYATFSSAPLAGALDALEADPADFQLVRVDEKDYFCVAFRQPSGRFGAGMDRLERRFPGQTITTRNWNTVHRIMKKALS